MKEFYLESDGCRLHAKLDLPEGYEPSPESKVPIAVIIHGFTGHMEERHIVAVAEEIRSLGMAALRVEMYGHGGSGGSFREHTLFKWLTNALTAIDYARKLDFVSDLYLCGHSQGGLTVMLAAAMERDRVKAILPLSPAWMIPEYARKGELLGVFFDPDRVPEEVSGFGDGQTLSGNYMRVAQTIDVERAIDAYRGPVLIVQGDGDEAVPLEYATRAAERYADAELVIIPGDTHCYDNHLDRMLEAVRSFLEAQLGA